MELPDVKKETYLACRGVRMMYKGVQEDIVLNVNLRKYREELMEKQFFIMYDVLEKNVEEKTTIRASDRIFYVSEITDKLKKAIDSNPEVRQKALAEIADYKIIDALETWSQT